MHNFDTWKERAMKKCHQDPVSTGLIRHILVSEPFPEPKSRRPVSMMGSMYGVPRNIAPAANVDEPRTQRNEKRNTPTERENYNQFSCSLSNN